MIIALIFNQTFFVFNQKDLKKSLSPNITTADAAVMQGGRRERIHLGGKADDEDGRQHGNQYENA